MLFGVNLCYFGGRIFRRNFIACSSGFFGLRSRWLRTQLDVHLGLLLNRLAEGSGEIRIPSKKTANQTARLLKRHRSLSFVDTKSVSRKLIHVVNG